MIKQADESDLSAIESILLDAVLWMKANRLQNLWSEDSITWASLSKQYQITDFYIDYQHGVPAGCMALTTSDNTYWPEVPPNAAFYLHKLAVKRTFAGKGISKELIHYAKQLSIAKGAHSLRLDCNFQREKLRTVYEKEGFCCVGKKTLKPGYEMALYIWQK